MGAHFFSGFPTILQLSISILRVVVSLTGYFSIYSTAREKEKKRPQRCSEAPNQVKRPTSMSLVNKYLIIGILLLCAVPSLFAQTDSLPRPKSGFLIDTVYFRFDSDRLSDDYKAELDSMLAVFTTYPSYYVEVYGHTDSIGTTGYNLDLSLRRAKETVLYLVSQGADLARIQYEGLGTNKPVGSNLNYAGRRKNRRVDIAVIFTTEKIAPIKKPEPVVAAPPPPPPAIIVDTIIRGDYEPFYINPTHKTIVMAPQGTEITMPPGAFLTDESEVEITIGELRERRDILVAQMTTLDRKGGTLESPGMFTFSARAGRTALKIDENASFGVRFPATRRDANMGVYSGRMTRARRPRRGQKATELPGDKPSMTTVKQWKPVEDTEVRFNGLDKKYIFSVPGPGAYSVARPLFYATTTDKEDKGIDIRIKFKGRRYPETTKAMITGEILKTYIPVKSESNRIYTAKEVKFLSDETEVVVVAYQFDDRGRAYWTKLTFKPGDFLNRSRRPNPRRRPLIKLKMKFRPIELEELNGRLLEIK